MADLYGQKVELGEVVMVIVLVRSVLTSGMFHSSNCKKVDMLSNAARY